MYLEVFLGDFAVFRVFLGISRVRDRAKYQKPWLCKKCMGNSWWSLQLSFLFMKNILNKGKRGPESLEPEQLKVEMAKVKNSETFQIIILSL